MRKLITIFLFLVLSSVIWGQTTIKYQSFEGGGDDWGYTPSPATYNVSGDVWAIVTSLGSLSTMPTESTNFWGMQDLNNPNGGGNFYHTLTFDAVNVSSYTSVQITFDWEVDGFDSGDIMKYEAFFDASSQGEVELANASTGEGTVTINVAGGTNSVYIVVSAIQDGGSDYAGVDNFKVTGTVSGTPAITVNPSSLSGFSYTVGSGPSGSQSFTVSGSDLTNDIVVTPPTNYEISDDDATFQSTPITLTESGGSVAETTVYTRLKAGLSEGNYNDEDITAASIGATSKTVTCSGDVTPVLPDLVINEILADPDATNGDANGDGTVNTSDDEFVEIINNESTAQNISGYTLSDGVSVRHTFPDPTIIPAGESIVVFGGGTPTGIPGTSQVASTGALGLNNSGDDVILQDGSSNIVASYTYGSEGGDNQSIGRNPDITGNFAKHSTFAPGGALQSPGKRNDDGSALPVELTSFSAIPQNNSVNLTWETATEVNNYGFEVERTTVISSEQSESRNSNWSKVGFVEGHGNSNSAQQYSYVDNSVRAGQSYSYRLKQIDFDGQFEYSSVVNVEVGVPIEFNLAQNYPNPFNPSTSIEYSVPSNEFVTLKVYDVLGNTVSILVNETKEAGKYNVSFDGSNLTSGIYFYSINAGGFTQVKKMMLVK